MTEEEFNSLSVGDKVRFFPERVEGKLITNTWINRVLSIQPDAILKVKNIHSETIDVFKVHFGFHRKWIEKYEEEFLTKDEMEV